MSSMNINFRFGFGLGSTCYNFATETAKLQVYNLSCSPKLFCSTNENCEIKYNAQTHSYPELTSEVDGKDEIKCEIKEGSAGAAYLFIAVEAGEQVSISFPYTGTDLEFEQLSFTIDGVAQDDDDSGSFDLSEAYRTGVQGESTLPQASLEGIKFDFYRVKVSVKSDFQNMVYNKNNNLCSYLKVTPKTFGVAQTNFARTIKFTACLTKDTTKPRLHNRLYGSSNSKDTTSIGSKNKRQRIVVTPEEAINYAITTNDASAPSFISGKSASVALEHYKESMLTETEKALDNYKLSFATTAMREKLALYIATDLSDDAADLLSSFTDATQFTCDISSLLAFTDVATLKTNVKSNLTDLDKVPSVSTIKSHSVLSVNLQTVLDGTLSTTGTPSTIKNTVGRPWEDGQVDEARKFGVIRDVSCVNTAHTVNHQMADAGNTYWGQALDTSGQKKTLMGQQSTILTLLYALNNHHATGSDDLVNRYAANMSLYDGNRLERLYQAMRTEYHGYKNWDFKKISDVSGASAARPEGLHHELLNYRYKLNPVDGKSANNYMCNILKLKAGGVNYYGANQLADAYNVPRERPSKTDVDELLYGTATGLETQIIGSNDFINTDTAIPSTTVENEFLKGTIAEGSDVQYTDSATYRRAVFYDSSTTTTVFGSDYSGVTKHQWNSSKTEDYEDISSANLNKKFVYNKDTTDPVYSEQNFHPENCDFSGVMKVPNSASGKYVDVYVIDPTTGKEIEVRETCVDVIASCENDGGPKTTDQSSNMDKDQEKLDAWDADYASGNNPIKESQKALRKTILNTNNANEKYEIVDVGIFQLYRTGNVLQWVANALDLDSEIIPAMTMPTLKLKYRHDVNEECVNIYKDNCLALKDVQSTLDMETNSLRSDIAQGIEGADNATYDYLVSRWGVTYIALDLSGFLERGEEFNLSIYHDKFSTSQNNYTTISSAKGGSGYSSLTALPTGCEDQGIKVEYKDARDPDSEWKNVSGVNFGYECHDHTKNMSTLGVLRNTHGDKNSSTPFNNAVSSNVKGTPIFRLCIPSQNKLLVLYKTGQPSGTNTDLANFGTLRRQVRIDLEYSKSSKLLMSDNSVWAKDSDGNDKSISVDFYVQSDQYEPNMVTNNYTYTKKYTGLLTTVGADNSITTASQDTASTIAAASTAVNVIGHKVKMVNGASHECEPDYTSLQKFNITQSSWSQRNVSFVACDIEENTFGQLKPISVLSLDNFEINGEYSATAEIIPLFQRKEDENDWETDKSVYCKLDNIRQSTDAVATQPRMIPANTNYTLRPMNNGSKFALFRKTAINYENWIGGTGNVVNGLGFYDATNNKPLREVVAVKVTYHVPNALFGSKGQKKDKIIVFAVKPEDCKEMKWQDTHTFSVNDGDLSVNIDSIFNATVEGKDDSSIQYYVRGFIEEDGTIYHTSELGDLSNSESFRAKYDISNMTVRVAQTADINFRSGSDVMTSTTDLRTQKINESLILYPEEAPLSKSFNSWTRCSYKILVEAALRENDQGEAGTGIERCLSLINIEVKQPSTGFGIKSGQTYYKSVTETLGTLGEGKSAEQNNAKILLETFTNKINHTDITDLYTQEQASNKCVTFKITDIDSALELCPGDVKDFSKQYIRLKDNAANKSTETATKASTELAHYAHYNYERQNEYKFTMEVAATKFKEIEVKKVPEHYVCELGRAAAPGGTDFPGTNLNSQYRTSTYMMVDGQTDPADSTLNDTLHYFCDPETKKYHGPLSTSPRTLSELTATKEIYGKHLLHAYVRYNEKNNGYTPLYKARGFAITDKPPQPEDSATMIFSIKVQDSYDKPKVCPQPYSLNECVDYYTSDPKAQNLLDNTLINVKQSDRHAMYVYTDNIDLGEESSYDFDSTTVPAWHPDTGTFTQFTSVIHPDMSNKLNPSYNLGLRNGDPAGQMNGSNRYGNFNMDNVNNRVVVDYLVESHGCIDASGRNEITREAMLGKPQVFGEQVDYSGTIKSYNTKADGTKDEVTGSDRRMYRLCRVNRNRLRDNDMNLTTNTFRYTTGELRFNDTHCPQVGDVYRFSIAAVTNILATKHDLSYNKSMVDYNQTFYPKVSQDSTGDDTGTSAIYPQQFQKYVYDESGERIVTLGYAVDNINQSGDKTVSANATADHTANQTTLDQGVLVVCRTHFKVCVKADGVQVTSTNPQTGATAVAKGLNFNSTDILEGSVNTTTNVITPTALFEAKEGDVRLFKNTAGTITMGVYKAGKWTTV
jgi:hypothetical protein